MVAVSCPKCGDEFKVTPEAAECAILYLHTQEKHRNHGLSVREEAEVSDLAMRGALLADTKKIVQLAVRCLNCGGDWTYEALPAHMVGAFVMVFHSHHEGHPLEFMQEGERLWPRP